MQKFLQSIKLSLVHMGHAQLDHKWAYDNVISPFSRMFYVTKGDAKVYHSDLTFHLKPGHMYLIPSYVYNRYKCDVFHEQYYISFFEEVKNGLSVYNLKHFKYEIEATETDIYYFKRLLEINPNRNIVNNDPKAYIHQPTTLLNFNKKNEKLATNLYMETQGILLILLSRFIKNTNVIQGNSSKGDLNRILVYIAENLHKNITVKELANYSNLSIDHFSRSFNHKFGMRPNRYVQSRRIERAQLLLLTTNDSISLIAEKVGLENFSYFSRAFKKFTGKTPGNFRKEQINI